MTQLGIANLTGDALRRVRRGLGLHRVDFSAAGPMLLQLWRRLEGLPGGRRLFDLVLGLINPYTGSVSPRFLKLAPGQAVVAIADRRAVRNHVGSVHAIALMNLAEMTTGLALMTGLRPGARAIPTRLCIDFKKKARGRLVARCACTPPATTDRQEVELTSVVTNASGEEVARATAWWLVGPYDARPDRA